MPATRNATTRMPTFTVSEQQWHQAFRELRRADWPDSLTDLQRKSLQYSLVRLRATLIARGIGVNPSPASSNAVQPRRDNTLDRIAPTRHRSPDRKCLAAGDRADD
jgi:hypothetical protein